MRAVVRPAEFCGAVVARRDGGGPYWRCLPHIAGPRPGWMPGALWPHFFNPAMPPDGLVVALPGAVVLGPGIVRLEDGTVVRESLLNCEGLTEAPHMRRDADGEWMLAPLPGDLPVLPGTFVALRQMWDQNYGHWLLEVLPRLAALAGHDALAEAKMLVSGHGGLPGEREIIAVQTASLGGFGVGAGRIRRWGWGPVRVERLLFSVPVTRQPWLKAPLAVTVLEDLGRRLSGDGAAGPARIFVRRGAGDRRQLLCEAAVWAVLRARGFVAVTPGEMDFLAQVRAFAGATHVVGVLGAGCANLAFSARGVRLLGLSPRDMQDDFFYDLVSLKGGEYFCLHGAGRGTGMNADFDVDMENFQTMLGAFLRPTARR